MNSAHNRKVGLLVLGALLVGTVGLVRGQGSEDALARGFKDPPDSAKPRVW